MNGIPATSPESTVTAARLAVRVLVWPAAALAVIGSPAFGPGEGSLVSAVLALSAALLLAGTAGLPSRFRPLAAVVECLAAGFVVAIAGGAGSPWLLLFAWLLLDHGNRETTRAVAFGVVPPIYLAAAWWTTSGLPPVGPLALHAAVYLIIGIHVIARVHPGRSGTTSEDKKDSDEAVVRLQERVLAVFGSLAEGDDGIRSASHGRGDNSRGARVLARSLHALLSRQPSGPESELRLQQFEAGKALESICHDWAACARARNLDLQSYVKLTPGTKAFGDLARLTRILDLLLLAGCFSATTGLVRLSAGTSGSDSGLRHLEFTLSVTGEADAEFVAWRVRAALEARAQELGGDCHAPGSPAEGEWKISLPADLEPSEAPEAPRLEGITLYVTGGSHVRPVIEAYLSAEGATLSDDAGKARLAIMAAPARDPETEAGCRTLKQAHSRLPLICQGSTVGVPASVLMEADAVLPLPFSRDELVRLVNQNLGRRAGREAPRVSTAPVSDAIAPDRIDDLTDVLVAEDDAISARVVTSFLESEGCRVHRVADGETALEALKTGSVRLALLDMHMPGLDGVEVAERYRQWEEEQGGDRLPLVALTASSADEDRRACTEAGMDDFLSKPVDREALRKIIERFRVGAIPVEKHE